MKNTIIFTDLDGTLLDAANYSHVAAQPALELVAARKVPLILCSSKTRAELELYRARLDNVHPFISENGGGIFIPQGYFAEPPEAVAANGYQLIRLGLPYAEIRQHFIRLRERLQAKVRGFADMTDAEVAALTGLPEPEAALARQRDFDEAFVFDGEHDKKFLDAIEAAGLCWTQGRIFHIMGRHDKGKAVTILTELYRREYGEVATIGLGDSLNDLPMLETVDQPVLIRHVDGSYDVRIDMPHLLRTQLPGPAGWNEIVPQLLARAYCENEVPQLERGCRQEIFDAALAAVDPYHAVLRSARVEGSLLQVAGAQYDLDKFERILVVGAGKATARMAQALETLLGNRICAGVIVVKDGHTAPLAFVDQVQAAHPVPDEAGIAGTRRILEMLRGAGEKTLVICLLSGGASALLVAPVPGLTLQDKQQTTQLLLNAGASIAELNAVRKHLSEVKGGRLAQTAHPARLVTLILSDVIGDRLDVIASGPTAPDDSTYADAWAVVEKYRLHEILPASVVAHLLRGIIGRELETVKPGDPDIAEVHNVIVAGLDQALDAAKEKSEQLGFVTKLVSATLQGEARDAARWLAQTASAELVSMHPEERRCLLCGGETTVTVRGKGKGGRNQELALAFALEVAGRPGVALLAAGTDGSDGPTDAAGAMVDGATAVRAREAGLEPLHYLEHNDAYTFFQQLDAATGGGCHFKTGPTGTNVMDIQIVLLEGT